MASLVWLFLASSGGTEQVKGEKKVLKRERTLVKTRDNDLLCRRVLLRAVLVKVPLRRAAAPHGGGSWVNRAANTGLLCSVYYEDLASFSFSYLSSCPSRLAPVASNILRGLLPPFVTFSTFLAAPFLLVLVLRSLELVPSSGASRCAAAVLGPSGASGASRICLYSPEASSERQENVPSPSQQIRFQFVCFLRPVFCVLPLVPR